MINAVSNRLAVQMNVWILNVCHLKTYLTRDLNFLDESDRNYQPVRFYL
jgi:hypothetical protein